MKNPLREEFGTFSVILLAFIPGARKIVLKVVRRFVRAIINNGKSYALIGA